MARIMSLNYSRQGKHRRLWRLAVATQPTIAGHQSAPCPEGTRIYQKPTASSEGAQLWDRHPLTLSWFRKAGQTIILNIIGDASVPLRGTHLGGYHIYPQLRCFAACSGFHDIGPASRNQERVGRIAYPTAALLRSLQWVSDRYVSPRDTAGRHSLPGLPLQRKLQFNHKKMVRLLHV